MKYTGQNIGVSVLGDTVSILRAAGMSARPGYYSGRGAIACDLNGEQLCAMYESVLHHHGLQAAEAFVETVVGLPKLTATDFILAFKQLEENNWTPPHKLGEENGFYVDAPCDTEEGQTQAMLGLFAALSGGSTRNETAAIRLQFVHWLQKLKKCCPDSISEKMLDRVNESAI